jgi:hypothetical protein
MAQIVKRNKSYGGDKNRAGETRPGSVAMEYFVHQQNLAHYRRLLADTELATSKDEIRHSMLMRLLAEEEAKEWLMPVDGTDQRPAPNEQSDGPSADGGER